jgi:hypothetical protein
MRHYLPFVLVSFIMIACSNNTEEKFGIIPYGSTIKEAKAILAKNNLKIISEDSRLDDGEVISSLKIKGSFHNENCEINYIFSDGIFYNGIYEFTGYSKERLSGIKDKLLKDLTEEFKIEPILKYDLSYDWELENKINVSLLYLDAIDSMDVIFYGIDYIENKK